MSDKKDKDTKLYPWVLVYTTNTLIDAEMLKSNLESGGIPTQIVSQIDTTRMFTLGNLAIVKVYVPHPYYSDAKAIIDLIESGEED